MSDSQNAQDPQETAEPSAAEPSAAEPSAAEPSAAEPSAAEPSAAEPSAAEPSAAELLGADDEEVQRAMDESVRFVRDAAAADGEDLGPERLAEIRAKAEALIREMGPSARGGAQDFQAMTLSYAAVPIRVLLRATTRFFVRRNVASNRPPEDAGEAAKEEFAKQVANSEAIIEQLGALIDRLGRSIVGDDHGAIEIGYLPAKYRNKKGPADKKRYKKCYLVVKPVIPAGVAVDPAEYPEAEDAVAGYDLGADIDKALGLAGQEQGDAVRQQIGQLIMFARSIFNTLMYQQGPLKDALQKIYGGAVNLGPGLLVDHATTTMMLHREVPIRLGVAVRTAAEAHIEREKGRLRAQEKAEAAKNAKAAKKASAPAASAE